MKVANGTILWFYSISYTSSLHDTKSLRINRGVIILFRNYMYWAWPTQHCLIFWQQCMISWICYKEIYNKLGHTQLLTSIHSLRRFAHVSRLLQVRRYVAHRFVSPSISKVIVASLNKSSSLGAQRQTVSLCSTSQSPLKAVLINFVMKTGPLWSLQNVPQYRIGK